MIDIRPFIRTMEHSKDRNGITEKSDVEAVLLDDEDGLAVKLGFHPGMLPKVDYFMDCQGTVQFFEFTDLRDSISLCENTWNT